MDKSAAARPVCPVTRGWREFLRSQSAGRSICAAVRPAGGSARCGARAPLRARPAGGHNGAPGPRAHPAARPPAGDRAPARPYAKRVALAFIPSDAAVLCLQAAVVVAPREPPRLAIAERLRGPEWALVPI